MSSLKVIIAIGIVVLLAIFALLRFTREEPSPQPSGTPTFPSPIGAPSSPAGLQPAPSSPISSGGGPYEIGQQTITSDIFNQGFYSLIPGGQNLFEPNFQSVAPSAGTSKIPEIPSSDSEDLSSVQADIDALVDAFINSFQETKSFFQSLAPTSSTSTIEALPLPVVADAEIIIDGSGVKTFEDYTTQLFERRAEIEFDYTKMAELPKDENGVFLAAPQLVEKALKNKDVASIQRFLPAYREFFEARIALLRKISVSKEMVSLHKTTIALDKLTLELLNKANAAASGTISLQELADFFNRYDATVLQENKKLLDKAHLSFIEKKGLVRWISDYLIPSVFAVSHGFGGAVTTVTPCTCTPPHVFGDTWVNISPPKPPIPTGSIFMPAFFLFGPLPPFYTYRAMHPGAWWLGLYAPPIIPCIVGFVPFCSPTPLLGQPPIILGTSP